MLDPSFVEGMACFAFRVLTFNVAVVDPTCVLEKTTRFKEIYAKIKRRAERNMKGFVD